MHCPTLVHGTTPYNIIHGAGSGSTMLNKLLAHS